MKPKYFKESIIELKKPQSITDEECGSLHIYQQDEVCISLWTVSFWERVKFLFHGHIWLGVLSGKTQPPVWLNCTKTVFIQPEKQNIDLDKAQQALREIAEKEGINLNSK